MLKENIPVFDIIYAVSTKFVMGVKIKATGDSKFNDSPIEIFQSELLKFDFSLLLFANVSN